MDLLGKDAVFNLGDKKFRIFSRNMARPPQFICENAEIENSMISEGCKICGKVVNSILSGGVIVEEGAEVYDSVIMSDVVIRSGAKVYYSIIDSDSEICEGATVGVKDAGKDNITVIAKESKIQNEVK